MRFVLLMVSVLVIVLLLYFGLRGVEVSTEELRGKEVSPESFCVEWQQGVFFITFAGNTRKVELESFWNHLEELIN